MPQFYREQHAHRIDADRQNSFQLQQMSTVIPRSAFRRATPLSRIGRRQRCLQCRGSMLRKGSHDSNVLGIEISPVVVQHDPKRAEWDAPGLIHGDYQAFRDQQARLKHPVEVSFGTRVQLRLPPFQAHATWTVMARCPAAYVAAKSACKRIPRKFFFLPASPENADASRISVTQLHCIVAERLKDGFATVNGSPCDRVEGSALCKDIGLPRASAIQFRGDKNVAKFHCPDMVKSKCGRAWQRTVQNLSHGEK
jgi:hypothetical protein